MTIPTTIQCLKSDPYGIRARLEELVPHMANISTVTGLANEALRRVSYNTPEEMAKWLNQKPILVSVVEHIKPVLMAEPEISPGNLIGRDSIVIDRESSTDH